MKGKTNMRRISWMLVGLTLFLGACDQGNERLVEKAELEGKAASEAEIEAANENLRQKAEAMEADLADRHRFYQALKGTYSGTLESDQATYRIKVTFAPSLPPYQTPRIRQLEEIVSDLNNLYFNVQVVQWNPQNPLSAVGCRVGQVRPDLLNGEVAIASESCPNLYVLRLSELMSGMDAYEPGAISASQVLAAQVREGKISSVDALIGEVHPSTNAAVYRLNVRRPE